ncbi:uncharacterized protein [Diabrotica undecimpunctata]|uniref:uncharacterized protein n=1 Tax=Diabrotica undecimpunctata TaxID=50387 RepID=UPI003B63900E
MAGDELITFKTILLKQNEIFDELKTENEEAFFPDGSEYIPSSSESSESSILLQNHSGSGDGLRSNNDELIVENINYSTKRGKRRKANRSQWKDVIRKEKKNKGEQFINRKDEEKFVLNRRVTRKMGKSPDILNFKIVPLEQLLENGTLQKVEKDQPTSSFAQEPRKGKYIELRPNIDVQTDQFSHWPSWTVNSQRCKFIKCKGKSKVQCEKCKVHLCFHSKNNCFKQFHNLRSA